ncbi:MAG: YkgJ family cysteine cluster protein [Spirochaetes bacterium]|nr:YkgJ family cysteine cluster protein [Spirochaetota bacterium]
MTASLLPYRRFIKEVDALCDRLGAIHRTHLSCRKGCFTCCTDISVLAVEAFSILRGVGTPLLGIPEEGKAFENINANYCVFLDLEGACKIYPYRPLICRTHGLPLLYPILEYDEAGKERALEEPAWQLFYCDLNFQGVEDEEMERVFTPETVLNMEEWNEQLVLINEGFRGSADGSSFLKAIYQGKFGERARKELFQTGRIPLSSLGWVIL